MNIYPIHKRKCRSEQSGVEILKEHQDEINNSFNKMFKDIERLKELDKEFRKVISHFVIEMKKTLHTREWLTPLYSLRMTRLVSFRYSYFLVFLNRSKSWGKC